MCIRDSQWTWHDTGFDIKYIGGGTFYHYLLFLSLIHI